MLLEADRAAGLNFRVHCIELTAGASASDAAVLAGEIGFSSAFGQGHPGVRRQPAGLGLDAGNVHIQPRCGQGDMEGRRRLVMLKQGRG